MGAESDETEYYPDLSPSPSDEEDRMPALMEVSQQKEEEVGCEWKVKHERSMTHTNSLHNVDMASLQKLPLILLFSSGNSCNYRILFSSLSLAIPVEQKISVQY